MDAYPSGTEVRKTGVTQFETGVQALFAINDYQRRRVSEHFRKYKNMVSAPLSYFGHFQSVLNMIRIIEIQNWETLHEQLECSGSSCALL